MSQWFARVVRFLKDEEGPTAVEYAVMLALIILVCFVAIRQVGLRASSNFDNFNGQGPWSSSS